MSLRWLERNASGAEGRKEKVLQYQSYRMTCDKNGYSGTEPGDWIDVPTVQEPRKAREFTIELDPMDGRPKRVWPESSMGILCYEGEKPRMEMLIKVREVLE